MTDWQKAAWKALGDIGWWSEQADQWRRRAEKILADNARLGEAIIEWQHQAGYWRQRALTAEQDADRLAGALSYHLRQYIGASEVNLPYHDEALKARADPPEPR